MANTVILSTPLLVETGDFRMEEISLDQARQLAEGATNFVGHSTVKLLGIEPAKDRGVCETYDKAIVIKPAGRLEFGREYSVEEIEEIGYTIFLISKTG